MSRTLLLQTLCQLFFILTFGCILFFFPGILGGMTQWWCHCYATPHAQVTKEGKSGCQPTTEGATFQKKVQSPVQTSFFRRGSFVTDTFGPSGKSHIQAGRLISKMLDNLYVVLTTKLHYFTRLQLLPHHLYSSSGASDCLLVDRHGILALFNACCQACRLAPRVQVDDAGSSNEQS